MKINGVLFVYHERECGLLISEPCKCLICGIVIFQDNLLYDVYGIHQFAKRTGIRVEDDEYLVACHDHRKQLLLESICPRL